MTALMACSLLTALQASDVVPAPLQPAQERLFASNRSGMDGYEELPEANTSQFPWPWLGVPVVWPWPWWVPPAGNATAFQSSNSSSNMTIVLVGEGDHANSTWCQINWPTPDTTGGIPNMSVPADPFHWRNCKCVAPKTEGNSKYTCEDGFQGECDEGEQCAREDEFSCLERPFYCVKMG